MSGFSASSYPATRQYGPIEAFANRVRERLKTLRRRWFPYLVWHGQPAWVRVTFTEAKLPAIEGPDLQKVLAQSVAVFGSGHIAEIERALAEIGIEFDTGAGPNGRDWEWDWSLRGPIEIRFVGK